MSVGGQGSDVAAAIIALGRALGLHVIGEGIEEPQQIDLLRSLGCEVGQVPLAKPMDAAALGALMRRGVSLGSV